jgi:hypothetical protein
MSEGGLSIIVRSDRYEDVHYALAMASAAVAVNQRAVLFFTMGGLRALTGPPPALEDWDRDPRAIENVRSYLADYRALTPEDVRRAVATWVTDQGDWSMLVLPARGAATAAAARDANGHNQ